jgi:hypothetical protein
MAADFLDVLLFDWLTREVLSNDVFRYNIRFENRNGHFDPGKCGGCPIF